MNTSMSKCYLNLFEQLEKLVQGKIVLLKNCPESSFQGGTVNRELQGEGIFIFLYISSCEVDTLLSCKLIFRTWSAETHIKVLMQITIKQVAHSLKSYFLYGFVMCRRVVYMSQGRVICITLFVSIMIFFE